MWSRQGFRNFDSYLSRFYTIVYQSEQEFQNLHRNFFPRFDSTGMTYYHSVLQRWTCIIPWCNYHINYTCHTLNVLIWGLSLQCLCCIGVLDYWNTNVYLYCIRLHTIVKAHTQHKPHSGTKKINSCRKSSYKTPKFMNRPRFDCVESYGQGIM